MKWNDMKCNAIEWDEVDFRFGVWVSHDRINKIK